MSPRSYPSGFGVKLNELHDSLAGKSRFDLRQKRLILPWGTDLEAFESMGNVDPYCDARMPSLFLYLFKNDKLVIPPSWQPCMEQYRTEMEALVNGWHKQGF